MVVNAPTSNILSVAEQAMALLLAQARNIPQAHAAAGGRALGALQVGGRRAARQGARRGRAGPGRLAGGPAGARLRHGADRLRPVRLARSGPGPWACGWSASRSSWPRPTSSPSTPRRRPRRSGSSGATCWPRPSPASASSTRPVAASSTRRRWPTPFATASWPGPASTSSPRSRAPSRPSFELPQVVVSPHLGASTEEAQDKAGVTIAEQVLLALAGDFVPYAVNVAATRRLRRRARRSWALAEQLGRFFVGLHDGLPDAPRDRVPGRAGGGESTGILTLSALKGIFGGIDRGAGVLRQRAAAGRAARAGRCASPRPPTSPDYKSLITLRSNSHSVAGTLITAGRAHRAAHRHGRRPRGRGAAVAAHAGRAQRRPARHDRDRRHRARAGRHLHLVHGRRAESRVRRRR